MERHPLFNGHTPVSRFQEMVGPTILSGVLDCAGRISRDRIVPPTLSTVEIKRQECRFYPVEIERQGCRCLGEASFRAALSEIPRVAPIDFGEIYRGGEATGSG